MKMNMRLLAIAVFVFSPSIAAADEPLSAELLFNRGVEQMNTENYESGCASIAESHRIEPLPGTLFTLATCMDRWGRIATAMALYGDYLAVYDKIAPERKSKQGERPKVAEKRRQELQPDVPSLKVVLPLNAPAGTTVMRNGKELPSAEIGVALPVDPGTYVITTQAPGGLVWERQITIEKGQQKTLKLEVKEPPPAVAPRLEITPSDQRKVGSREVPRANDQRTAGYIASGFGAAGLVVGVMMGGLMFGKKDAIDQHCGMAIGAPEDRCDSEGLRAARAAKVLGIGSAVGVALGLVGLGSGVLLFTTNPQSNRTKVVSKRSWIGAEFVFGGRGHLLLGVRGSF